MEQSGLPVLPHQQATLAQARALLEQDRPGLALDAAAALRWQPGLLAGAAAGQGEAVAALGRAVGIERRERQALEARGLAAVQNWAEMEREYERAGRAYDRQGQRAVGSRMEAFAKALKQDQPLDRLLRERGQELGVAPGSRLEQVAQARQIDRALTRSIDLEHGQRQGPSMER